MNITALQQAMVDRHSVRKYQVRPIEKEKVEQLQALINECNQAGNLHIQLVLNEPKAFSTGLFSYGKFTGVTNYIAMICNKGDDTTLGYYGEKIVLTAQAMGLNTCWVALTFSKQKDQYEILPGEKLICVIALGYGLNQGVAHPQKKGIEHYCKTLGEMPEWFRRGMEAVLLAPTAINQQKFEFQLIDSNHVRAITRPTILNPYPKIDLGIAKFHFELGAGSDNFTWAD